MVRTNNTDCCFKCNHQLLKLFILCKKEQPKHLKYSCQTNQLSIENYKRKLQLLYVQPVALKRQSIATTFGKKVFFAIYTYTIFCLKKSL